MLYKHEKNQLQIKNVSKRYNHFNKNHNHPFKVVFFQYFFQEYSWNTPLSTIKNPQIKKILLW
jgi:hypothetical protein